MSAICMMDSYGSTPVCNIWPLIVWISMELNRAYSMYTQSQTVPFHKVPFRKIPFRKIPFRFVSFRFAKYRKAVPMNRRTTNQECALHFMSRPDVPRYIAPPNERFANFRHLYKNLQISGESCVSQVISPGGGGTPRFKGWSNGGKKQSPKRIKWHNTKKTTLEIECLCLFIFIIPADFIFSLPGSHSNNTRDTPKHLLFQQ